jgi:hypothetical protein
MSVIKALKKIESKLYGSKVTEVEIKELIEKLPSDLLPVWLIKLVQEFKLLGIDFSLKKEDDESKRGVEIKLLNPKEMTDEALMSYPEKVVIKLGYLPFGCCCIGSGDPYFLKIKDCKNEDPLIVRVPHDYVIDDETYPEEKIEIVCLLRLTEKILYTFHKN